MTILTAKQNIFATFLDPEGRSQKATL